MRLSPPFLVPSLASHCPAPAPALRPLGLPGGGLRLWSVRAVKGRRRLGSPLDSHCSAGQGHGPRSPCARWGGGWGGSAWSPLFRPPALWQGGALGQQSVAQRKGAAGRSAALFPGGRNGAKVMKDGLPVPGAGPSVSPSTSPARPHILPAAH